MNEDRTAKCLDMGEHDQDASCFVDQSFGVQRIRAMREADAAVVAMNELTSDGRLLRPTCQHEIDAPRCTVHASHVWTEGGDGSIEGSGVALCDEHAQYPHVEYDEWVRPLVDATPALLAAIAANEQQFLRRES